MYAITRDAQMIDGILTTDHLPDPHSKIIDHDNPKLKDEATGRLQKLRVLKFNWLL